MRSVVLACASLAALLAAAPAFANCTTDFGRVERNVQQLRNGPNTRAAIRELDRARAARSEAVCEGHVRSAAAYAQRSARADRAAERRHRRAPLRSTAGTTSGRTEVKPPPVGRRCPIFDTRCARGGSGGPLV